jgi:hypothetical protein
MSKRKIILTILGLLIVGGDCSLELEVIGGNTPSLRPHPDERIDDRQPAS